MRLIGVRRIWSLLSYADLVRLLEYIHQHSEWSPWLRLFSILNFVWQKKWSNSHCNRSTIVDTSHITTPSRRATRASLLSSYPSTINPAVASYVSRRCLCWVTYDAGRPLAEHGPLRCSGRSFEGYEALVELSTWLGAHPHLPYADGHDAADW